MQKKVQILVHFVIFMDSPWQRLHHDFMLLTLVLLHRPESERPTTMSVYDALGPLLRIFIEFKTCAHQNEGV